MDTPTQEMFESKPVNSSAERITLPELQRAVHKADPAAILVLPRILRRVIKQDRHLAGYLYRIPHRKSYFIDRESLLESVDCEELGVSADEELPDKVILLAQPSPQKLEAMPAGEALTRCWRLLFHSRVHLAVQQSFVLGFLSPSQVRKRIHQIGETEFEEIRAVLQHEGFLLPPREDYSQEVFSPSPDLSLQKDNLSSSQLDAVAYEEFAAVFFELKYFAWNSLPRYFPDLRDLDAVAEVLELDVNAQAIFKATRPLGTPGPTDYTAIEKIADWDVDPAGKSESTPLGAVTTSPAEAKFRRTLRRAQRPAALGNVVRAAIWRAKALHYAPPEMVARTKSAIRDDVNRLILRLHAALDLKDPSPQPWHDTLRPLVYLAADGFWTAEGRLLYDLQKVCVDRERVIYSTNLLSWLWSYVVLFVTWIYGRLKGAKNALVGSREVSPLKQPLPNQRDVLMSQHLRTAERRLTAVRLPETQRRQLGELLRTAIARVESQLREHFRPLIHKALDEVGLTPANFPEKIARDKLVEELLDQTAERGFLSIGDLRDALSRNNMKLPDFGGIKDLYYGDPLLKADRSLSEILRGVYRPAEFYLRWLQQLTSLGFGTRIGRFLTLYIVVPFGGSYLNQKFVDYLLEHFGRQLGHWEQPFYWTFAILFFGLVNVESFRRLVWRTIKGCGHFVSRWVFLPLWRIVHSRIVQVILHSRTFRLLYRFLMKPAFWTLLIWLAFPLKDIPWLTLAGRAAILFLSLNLLLNSRLGRTLEEMAADWTVQTWHRYGWRFLAGLFWWMVDFFKLILETIERLMYSVDEWLRFKSGDSQFLFAMKAVLGLFWSAVAYVLRFCVNLLIEPQINPIKHFPVVTVSHKLLLPLYPYLGGIFAMHMEKELAFTTATLLIWCIPGIFGFLVWELRENWRLYAANRPKGLQPMIIGSHGETMGRLLRSGFHSGTIPKLFAKLRRAERKARKSGDWKTVRKHLHSFEHIEILVRRYVERDFLALFNQSRHFNDLTLSREGEAPGITAAGISLQAIQLGTNRLRLIFSTLLTEQPLLAIDFAIQSGWLLGSAMPLQSESDCDELSTAILGLYKTAGVEIVRQQLETAFPDSLPAYDLSPRGLRIWPDASFETEVFYEFSDESHFAPQVLHGVMHRPLPTLERTQLLYREYVLTWRSWVIFWEAVKRGEHPRDKDLLIFPVLPLEK
jgi:hypothetical protein